MEESSWASQKLKQVLALYKKKISLEAKIRSNVNGYQFETLEERNFSLLCPTQRLLRKFYVKLHWTTCEDDHSPRVIKLRMRGFHLHLALVYLHRVVIEV